MLTYYMIAKNMANVESNFISIFFFIKEESTQNKGFRTITETPTAVKINHCMIRHYQNPEN